MYALGIIIGIIDIITGVVAIIMSAFMPQNSIVTLILGITSVLSGMLFIWLCNGAKLARDNSDNIEELGNDIKFLKYDNEKLKSTLKMLEEKVNYLPQTKGDKKE